MMSTDASNLSGGGDLVCGPAQPAAAEPGRRGTTMTAQRRGWMSDRGLSLVEVTIMLVILLILAGMLVPVMSDSMSAARGVTARTDLSRLSVALVDFTRDVGPVVFEGTRVLATSSSIRPVELLVSGGDLPDVADRVPLDSVETLLVNPAVTYDASSISSWVISQASDRMEYHLRVNGRGYPEVGTGSGNGWNGPYLTKDVLGDPWGHAYLINTGFLRGLPPSRQSCARCAVFVISAGPNGLLETPFRQPTGNAQTFGDDLTVRIQ